MVCFDCQLFFYFLSLIEYWQKYEYDILVLHKKSGYYLGIGNRLRTNVSQHLCSYHYEHKLDSLFVSQHFL